MRLTILVLLCFIAAEAYQGSRSRPYAHLRAHNRRRPILKMDETVEADWKNMDKIPVPEGLYEMAGAPKKSNNYEEDPYRQVFKEKMEKLSKQLASERKKSKNHEEPMVNLEKSFKIKKEPSMWAVLEQSGEKDSEENIEKNTWDLLDRGVSEDEIEKMDEIPSPWDDSDEKDDFIWDPTKIDESMNFGDSKKSFDDLVSEEVYSEENDSWDKTEEYSEEEEPVRERNLRGKIPHSDVKILPKKRYGYFEDSSRRNLKRPCAWKPEKVYEYKTAPRSWEYPGFEATLPREWDWRNVSNVNYCSPTRNQHIPVYCGSCWVFGTLGMLNDRFNVARKGRWPMTFLSPQEVINCNGQGNCSGGTPGFVFEHAKLHGLVEEGCNNYKAINEVCDPYHRCGTCWPGNCYALQNYTRFYVTEYGPVSGREAMMAEIHNRGPIACTIGGTAKFDFKYTGGVYQELADEPFNHNVAVTGWGIDPDTNVEYWIVRNSWGEAWGEKGWFKIVTSLYKNGRGDEYNMGIERECFWADVDISNLD